MTTTEDAPDLPPLRMGFHVVDAPCPRCGLLVEAYVWLSTVLTSPQDDVPTLRVKSKSKPVEHDCRHGAQTTLRQAVQQLHDIGATIHMVSPE